MWRHSCTNARHHGLLYKTRLCYVRHALRPSQRRQVHLWIQLDQRAHSLNRQILEWEPLKFNFNEMARRCRINLKIHKNKANKQVVNLTVQEALEKYIKPGWLLQPHVPRRGELTDPRYILSRYFVPGQVPRYDSTHDDGQYDAAIPLYALYDIAKNPKPKKKYKDYPMMIIWTALDAIRRVKSVMSSAFQKLSTLHAVSSFAVLPKRVVKLSKNGAVAKGPDGILLSKSKKYQNTETRTMVGWTCKYMPHVWPNVILASMPEQTQIWLGPHSNGAQVQWAFQRSASATGGSESKDEMLRVKQKEVALKAPSKGILMRYRKLGISAAELCPKRATEVRSKVKQGRDFVRR